MKMTKQEKPEGFMGANPYNKNKEWDDEGKTGEAFQSADDSMAYVKKQKTVVMDKMENEPKVEATPEPAPSPVKEEKPEKWKKVDYKKRYDDLKRHYDTKVNSFKEKEKELREQIRTASPKYEPPKTAEELAKFKEDNPDIYNVVETVSHLQASEQMEELQTQLKEMRESLQMEEARRAYAELKTLVPDFEEIRQSEEFHQWAEVQPQEIQDWVYKNRTNVELAAQAINLYKASVGQLRQQPPDQRVADQRGGADEAVSVQSRNEEPMSQEKIWTSEEISALSIEQYEGLRDEIDRAFAEGRVRVD